MYYIYILESKKDNSRYIGSTADLKTRLSQHNQRSSKYTSGKAPYRLIWYGAFSDKDRALAFEKYLKSSSGFAFRNKRLI